VFGVRVIEAELSVSSARIDPHFESTGAAGSSLSKSKLDRRDLRILGALCQNGRETMTELSKRVGLSATPCSARVEDLQSTGMILGYHADVDVERLGDLSLYCVTIALKSWTPTSAHAVESLIMSNPYIVACDSLFGSIDYVIWVYARSTQHYHSILEPFQAFELDYTTYPVSRRLMRPRLDRLIMELAKG